MKKQYFLLLVVLISFTAFAQNVGIGTTTPTSKLHIKGSADASQFIIDANSTQSSTNPLIKLRKSDGTDLMWIHSDHPSNSFLGFSAGKMNQAFGGGVDNTFIGSLAGLVNTTGTFNTAVGYEALFSNTTGSYNTALGLGALSYNTTANYNTAIGFEALNFNTTGDENTAVGYNSLFNNTTGHTNTANGVNSLVSNVTGDYIAAFGYGALYYNTTGSFNTAIGLGALYHSTTVDYNTAIGYEALFWNTTGIYNTAVGYESLFSNTTGNYNTANGYEALYSSTTGVANTACGYEALYSSTTSVLSVGLGYFAGRYHGNGFHNTFLGAFADATQDDFYNDIAIGYDAKCTAAHQARIGNNEITSIGGKVGWTTFSDGRYKKDVQENVRGIDFIMKLRPVTYQLDISSLNQKLYSGRKDVDSIMNISIKKSVSEQEKTIQTGFIAQEVERAANEMGYDFSGVDKPKNENDFYGLRYAEFVVPLVKAVQEQQEFIKDQNKKIDEQQQKINQQQQQIDALIKDVKALKEKLNQ